MKPTRCPMCANPTQHRATGPELCQCGVRIERNTRGEADRAWRRHRSGWQLVYSRRHQAYLADDHGQRRTTTHGRTTEQWLQPGELPTDIAFRMAGFLHDQGLMRRKPT
jgi:hypothetical protein